MNRSIAIVALALWGCDPPATTGPQAPAASQSGGQSAVEAPPPTDPKNIVNIAAGSPDHTTLVAALKAAAYLTSISNPGPFTVFAPTNAAFQKLPEGTVEGLVKPDKQAELRHILKYHVTVSTYQVGDLHDGDTLGMANGDKVTVHVKDGKTSINDATIVASIPASNGIVHVIDGVLLPPKK